MKVTQLGAEYGSHSADKLVVGHCRLICLRHFNTKFNAKSKEMRANMHKNT